MFYHVKDLQFNARVSKPDPAFATLLLEQFGGANGELAAALRYFGQAFAARNPFPDKYDLLMDIATEEFSHLEIVGATIQMLLQGVNGDLKKAADESEIMQMLDGRKAKEEIIHKSLIAPQFLTTSAGGPAYTNSQGVPWSAAYINGDCNGDLTVDLRSDIAAESRAKITYEYLFTNRHCHINLFTSLCTHTGIDFIDTLQCSGSSFRLDICQTIRFEYIAYRIFYKLPGFAQL